MPGNSAWAEQSEGETPGNLTLAEQLKGETPGNLAWAEAPEGEKSKCLGILVLGIQLGSKSQGRAEYPEPNCHQLLAECPLGQIDWVPTNTMW